MDPETVQDEGPENTAEVNEVPTGKRNYTVAQKAKIVNDILENWKNISQRNPASAAARKKDWEGSFQYAKGLGCKFSRYSIQFQ